MLSVNTKRKLPRAFQDTGHFNQPISDIGPFQSARGQRTGAGCLDLPDLKEQHEQNGRANRLEQHEPNQHLSVRPSLVVSYMVVKRVAHVLEDGNLEKPQHHDLYDTGCAID